MMSASTGAAGRHQCDYDWCRADRTGIEHWGDGELNIGHHYAAEIEKIQCYAFVTVDGTVYEDEITFSVDTEDSMFNASLTVEEATHLRDLIDTAIANRAEIRGTEGMRA